MNALIEQNYQYMDFDRLLNSAKKSKEEAREVLIQAGLITEDESTDNTKG